MIAVSGSVSPPEGRQKLAARSAVLTAVGFGLRLAEMRDYWISADEGLRHFIARAPIAEAVELVLANAHPPLFAALRRSAPLPVALRRASPLFAALRQKIMLEA